MLLLTLLLLLILLLLLLLLILLLILLIKSNLCCGLFFKECKCYSTFLYLYVLTFFFFLTLMICKQDKNSVIWSMMKDSVLMTKHRLYWYREQNFPINVWLTMNFCFQRIGTGYLSVSRRSLATPVADSTEG